MLLLAAALHPPAAPVFTRDIAPILYKHCATCHHEGEVAPFPLITYEDASKRARLIAEVTRTRAMPPWKPVTGYNHFANERRLSETEIQTIQRWAATGARKGSAAALPSPPVFNEDWKLGKPDLVVQLREPFEVPAEGTDVYECFIVPMKLTHNRFIRAVEFRPSNRRVVHHALLFADSSYHSQESRYPCFGSVGLLPTLGLGGWSPGMAPIQMLDGAAPPLQAGSKLVAQVHYHPDGRPEQDTWSAGFYFTDQAPVRRVVDVGLSSNRIDIPAGDAHYVVTAHFTIPIAIDAVGVIPHAHLLCREMRGWAILPDGRKQWLLNIRDWDFNWQDQFQYARPIRLPADSRLEMEFVYDNSAANPRNPNSPPQRVQWGPGTNDEMAGLHVQSIPVHMEELPELGKALWGAVMRSVGGSFYRLPPR
ncbi:MAG TPA: hypothetical protein VHZ74_02895 [Bryobacteraceae bacterium]|nr:hypothetical protein [Bryobacteraceae bacterium]